MTHKISGFLCVFGCNKIPPEGHETMGAAFKTLYVAF